jgi:hypothetical protein
MSEILVKGAEKAAMASIQDNIIQPNCGADMGMSFWMAGIATFMAVKPMLPKRFEHMAVARISLRRILLSPGRNWTISRPLFTMFMETVGGLNTDLPVIKKPTLYCF